MRKSNIILLSIAIVLISVIIAILTNCKLNDIILSAATQIAAFSGLATLIVALALYNRFKVDQNIIDKQGERVVELLVILRDILFYMDISTNNSSQKKTYSFRIWVNQIFNKEKRQFLESAVKDNTLSEPILLFGNAYINSAIGLENMFNDIYTPELIKNKLKEYSIMGSFNDFDMDSESVYGHISIGERFLIATGAASSIESKEPEKFGPIISQNTITLKDRNFTLKMFLDQWQDILKTVEDWLRINAPAAAESMGISKK